MAKFNFGGRINYTPYQLKDFLGVDFTNNPSEVSPRRSPDALNVIQADNSVVEKRTGWETLHTFASGKKVYGIHSRKEVYYDGIANDTPIDVLYVHVGTELWRLEKVTWSKVRIKPQVYTTVVYVTMAEEPSLFIETGQGLIIVSGGAILQEASSSGTSDPLRYTMFVDLAYATGFNTNVYIPTTVIARAPTGGGTTYEPINVLQSRRKNSFLGTGTAYTYQLDATTIDAYNLLADPDGYKNEVPDSLGFTGYGEVTAKVLQSDGSYDDYKESYLNGIEADSGLTNPWSADASTNVLTRIINHNLVVDDCVAFVAKTGVLPTGISPYPMLYYVKTAPSATTITISATKGGAVVDFTTNGTVGFEVKKADPLGLVVNRTLGTVRFVTPPAVTPITGQDNVLITFYKKSTVIQRIAYAKVFATYGLNGSDDYIFLGNLKDAGNLDYYVRSSDLYCPDTSYTRFGSGQSEIMGYSRLGEALAIHLKSDAEEKVLYLRTVTLDANDEIIFPVKQGLAGIDAIAIGSFAVLRDDPLFLSQYGIVSLSTNQITNTQAIQDRGYYINRRLLAEANVENAVATIFDNKYMIFVNGNVYIADSRKKYTERNAVSESFQYEWYFWSGVDASAVLSYEGTLYFGTSDGKLRKFKDRSVLHAYMDDSNAVQAYWCTPVIHFDNITAKKSLKNLWVRMAQNARGKVKIFYKVRGDLKQVKEHTYDMFDFNNIDFTRFTFETDSDPEIIVTNRVERQFMSIQFKILNEENSNFGLIEMVAHYRTNSAYKGG